MCLIAIIVHIYDNDVLNCDNLYTSHVDDNIYPFCILDKSLGVENDPLGQANKMGVEKIDKN